MPQAGSRTRLATGGPGQGPRARRAAPASAGLVPVGTTQFKFGPPVRLCRPHWPRLRPSARGMAGPVAVCRCRPADARFRQVALDGPSVCENSARAVSRPFVGVQRATVYRCSSPPAPGAGPDSPPVRLRPAESLVPPLPRIRRPVPESPELDRDRALPDLKPYRTAPALRSARIRQRRLCGCGAAGRRRS